MAVKIPIVSVFDAKGLRQAERAFGKLRNNLAQATRVIAGVGVAFAAVTAAGIALAKMGEEAATSNARITQIAETMGLFGEEAGAVSKRLQDLAKQTAISTGFDIDSIKATQAKLLTFKNLAQTADDLGGNFDRATKAAIDLAAAGFGQAETNAVQLGKALQDPIKGITALARSGVTFTQQEKDKIKALVESNKTFEAQQLILSAIETQVGGTALATANASDKINQAFKIFGQDLGIILLPAFEKILGIVTEDLLPRLEEILPALVQTITDALMEIDFEKFAEDIANSIGWLVDNAEGILETAKNIGILIAVMWGLNTAIKAVALAQALWNIALTANPIGLIIVGVAALIAIIALVTNYLVEQYGGWDKLFTDIQIWLENFVKGFKEAVNKVQRFFKEVFEGVGDFFKGLINGWISLFESFINFFIGGINGIIGRLNTVLNAIKAATFGAVSLQVSQIPNVKIPRLAEGGLVMPRPGGVLANIAEGGQAEAVIPLDRLGQFGERSGPVYNITVNGGLDSSATIGQAIITAIRNYERQSGAAWRA